MDNWSGNKKRVVIFLCFVFTVSLALGAYAQQPLDQPRLSGPLLYKQYGPKAFKERLKQRLLARKVQASQPTKPTPDKKACPPSCDELLAKARQHGTITVIVELNIRNLPDETHVPKEHRSTVMQARQAAISQAQDRLLQRMASHKIKVVSKFKLSPGIAVSVGPAALSILITDPEVTRIHENVWFRPMLPQSGPLIRADQAWANGFTGAGWAIAILDTGVDVNHPFLASKIIAEACFSGSVPGSTSLCPNGQISQTGPGAGTHCNLPGCDHGTHVAGIAAGNGFAFSGVGKDANIIAVQVFSNVDGFISASLVDLRNALDEVRNISVVNDVVAVNMSLGVGAYADFCDDDSDYVDLKTSIDQLRNIGVATIVASGNDGLSAALSAPACISTAISVGATTKSDAVPPYSNSASFLSLLAPGGDGSPSSSSAQCVEGLGGICSSTPGNTYAYLSGTSMAAPHVAGAFAVLRQQSPTASVNDIKSILESSGVQVADTRNNVTKPRIRLGNTPWITRYNGPAGSDEEISAIALDSAGNVYVTGTSCSDESCDASEFATVSYNPNGQQRWVRRYGNGFFNVAAAIAVDSAANVYITGASCPDDICINADFLTAKYDSGGNLQWTTHYVNSGPDNGSDDAPVAIAVDGFGNVHIAGTACDTSEDCNIVVIKYASDGAQLWVASYHNVASDRARDMVLDAAGNIYVSGSSCFTSPCQTNFWSVNMNPVALKYDGNGNLLWVARYVDEYSGGAVRIVTDQTGSVYIAGVKQSGDLSSVPNDLLVKYDSNGNQLWHVSSGLEGVNNDLVVDETGNVLVTGQSGNFGYSTRKYTGTGALIWEAILPESDNSGLSGGEALALSVDSTNSPVVVGKVDNVFSEGHYIGTVKYDANGNQVWKHYLGGSAGGRTPVVTVDSGRNVFIAGMVLSANNASSTDYATLKYSP